MIAYRTSGQETPVELGIETIPLGPGQRARLGIRYVTDVWGPFVSEGRPLLSGEYTVRFEMPDSRLSGTLVYRIQTGSRVLREIRQIRKDGVSSLDAQDLRSISFTAIESEFVSILDDHRISIADTAFRTSFGELAYSPATLPGTGRALTDEDLLTVAVKYSRLGGVRGLYTQLAEQCGGISESRARDLVRRTRQEGFLEPTVRGRANHALTEKARQLIRDRQTEEQDVCRG